MKMNSGQLLSSLNRHLDKHHQKKVYPLELKEEKVLEKVENKQEEGRLPTQVNVYEKDIQKSQQKIIIKESVRDQSFKEQNKTVRSNISKAFQIKQKNRLNPQFSNSKLPIFEEQFGETLHDILALQIGKLVSEPLAEVIENVIKERQDNVYITVTKDQLSYLQNLLEKQKKQPSNLISDIEALLSKREFNTMNKLQNGQLYIDRSKAIKSKDQIEELIQMDISRMLKIKQGAIRSKIDLLNDKMLEIETLQNKPKEIQLQESLQEKFQQINDPNNFKLNSEKTKIANDYVKHLQQQKLILLKNMRQRQQKRSQMQKQRQTELKQAQQMRIAVKKQEIQQKIKQYKKRKDQEQSQTKQKQKKVQEFLKQYRKSLPLYKKKQKQFVEVYQKKKNKEFEEKLKAIKETHRSMSLNEIRQHEQKYLERKSQDQSKKEEEFNMMMKARKASESEKQYFKGYYHEKVKVMDQEERLKFYSLRESTKMKVGRVSEFEERIRKYHKPKVDAEKKQALQRIIELDQLKKKKVKKIFKQVQDDNGESRIEAFYEEIPEVNYYKEGNRYMEIAKSLAKKKRPEQLSRYSEELHVNSKELEKVQNSQSPKRKKSQLSEQSSPIISQQKDIWRLRGKQLHQMTDDINPHNFQQVKKNLQLMDDKAKMRQALLKHKQSQTHEIMEQKAMLDEFYLESIKNKIKLLNQ